MNETRSTPHSERVKNKRLFYHDPTVGSRHMIPESCLETKKKKVERQKSTQGSEEERERERKELMLDSPTRHTGESDRVCETCRTSQGCVYRVYVTTLLPLFFFCDGHCPWGKRFVTRVKKTRANFHPFHIFHFRLALGERKISFLSHLVGSSKRRR